MLVPLPGHDFQVGDALGGHDLGLVHALHARQRLAQPFEVHTRCDGQRQTGADGDRMPAARASQTATNTAHTANTPVAP
jgi:hypothetical protein